MIVDWSGGCRISAPPTENHRRVAAGRTRWEFKERNKIMQAITLDDGYGRAITVPMVRDWSIQRENGPDNHIADTPLTGQVMVGCPVGVTILLRTDGTWVHWQTDFDAHNHYLHFADEGRFVRLGDDYRPVYRRDEPTAAQRRTLARWWLGDERPYGMTIGEPVARWAFAGLTPQQISDRYGDGRPVYLA